MYRQQMYVSNTASGGDTPSGATIVSLINGELGQTTWQSGGSGTPVWGAISGTLSAQTDLQVALDDKSDVGHDHDGAYAAASHNHDSAYAAIAHGHAVSDVTGLQADLDGKSDTGHSHAAATTSAAGFLSAGDKGKLDGIEAGATADQTAAEILSAVQSESGRALATDGTKLDTIESGATADQTGAEIVAAIDGQLGGSGWQSGGSGTPTWGGIIGTLSSQTDLQGALDGKSDTSHNHDSAYAAIAHAHSGTYAPVAHNHDGSYALISHNHDGSYAASSHAHSISDVTGLQSALDGKVSSAALVSSDANNTITADPKFWSGTQANYDAIVTKDGNTLYFIEG